MRRLFYHVVTMLVPELPGKDALLNETVAEIGEGPGGGGEDLSQVRHGE
jgi:hypothetical protein